MDRQELDSKIADIAKSILSYCIARTSDHFEAEDLAQDIILEVYKSAHNLRSEEAFYGFMWSVAGNMYKNWCKNKAKNKECELQDNLLCETELLEDEEIDKYLLRRELTLLNEKYRKAVILYYIENKSCSEISDLLMISESMVKYLLFKSRQILKEGMNMERNYGEQSYNPKELLIAYWGTGTNRYYRLCDSKISQNILFACYNDKLTAEQISLEIGVALPYMEDNLNELCEYDVLKKDGNRYYTNIVIFTGELSKEIGSKTSKLRDKIADILVEAITENEENIRNIGFVGANMNSNAFAWQMVSIILDEAVLCSLQDRVKPIYPKDKFGEECFVWGNEKESFASGASEFVFGVSSMANKNMDRIEFMDFKINGEMVHQYFFNRQNVTNVFLDIARGNTEHFSENDMALAADMVSRRFVISDENGLAVNVPVFTREQCWKLKNIFETAIKQITDEAEVLMETVEKIIKNHIPVHLKKSAKDMAYLRLFGYALSAPVSVLYERKYLHEYNNDGMLPTTYVMLN